MWSILALSLLLNACVGYLTVERFGRNWPHYTHNGSGLTVKAPSGTYIGIINGTAPDVRQFLRIPFAKPPTGDLRWLPPQKPNSSSTDIFDATRYPSSCPQWVTPIPDIFNQVVPEWLINSAYISEDCLALAVWSPIGAQNLPVIMFMTGGGYIIGGVDINYQLPYHWVQRTRSHIVVTINYRLNIFGFPNAAGLDQQNLGILDQRMALEWVRDNIRSFGGDPSKITLWGQSAGAASVDYHNFAFYEDPIVTGFYAASGSVGLDFYSRETTNFTFVAEQLHCDQANTTATLACMRQVPWPTIIDTIGPHLDNKTLNFYPHPDEKIIFSNYTERYAAKKLSPRPAIFSTCQDEGNVHVQFHPQGINQTASDEHTDMVFLCPAADTASLRTRAGAKTYRSLYTGNFSNVSPLPWMGAYHDTDLSMVFGTHQDFGEPSTPLEYETSHAMQDFVLAFMEDPENGMERRGWEDVTSGLLMVFGQDGVAARNASLVQVQAVCADVPANPI